MKKLLARKPSYVTRKIVDGYALYRYDARRKRYELWQRFRTRADAMKVAAERRKLGI